MGGDAARVRNAHLDDGAWAAAVLRVPPTSRRADAMDLPVAEAAGEREGAGRDTATNPNKAAHVGHLRNACVGDTVARVLRRTGHTVEVDDCVDDLGVQVADVMVGIRELGVEQRSGEPFDQYCSRVYVEVSARDETDPDLAQRRHEVLRLVEEGGNETGDLRQGSREARRRRAPSDDAPLRYRVGLPPGSRTSSGSASGGRPSTSCAEFGRDRARRDGRALRLLGHALDDAVDEGADNDTKVLVKSVGIATYTAKDIAHQLWKFGLLDGTSITSRGRSDPWLMTTATLPQPSDAAAHFGLPSA